MNRRTIAAMGVMMLAVAATAPARAAPPLAAWRWRARVLLVFAPDETSAALREQRRQLAAGSADQAERDLITIEIIAGHAEHGADAERLRGAYRVAAGQFAVVLIGKDGGEKFRTTHPTSADALFGIIDRMPMRRQERATR